MSYWLLHRTDHVDVHGSALIASCHLKGDWYCGITDQGCMASDNDPFGGNLVERRQRKKVRRGREMKSERREDGFNGSLAFYSMNLMMLTKLSRSSLETM